MENAFDPSLFVSCAYYFMILSDEQDDFLIEVCDAILEFIETVEEMNNSEAFAKLSVLCILALSKEKMEFYFKKFFEKSICILENAEFQLTEITNFAVMFIVDCFYSKSLINLLPDNTYEYLQKMNNWNSIISFFIAKYDAQFQSNTY